jgi:hypothetical protein
MSNIKIGEEVRIQTKDGNGHDGIFLEIKNGYISAIAKLGIILTIPETSILNVSRLHKECV